MVKNMSEFYGTMRGSKSQTTRTGTKNSGIFAVLSSYDNNASVRLMKDADGKDVLIVRKSGNLRMVVEK